MGSVASTICHQWGIDRSILNHIKQSNDWYGKRFPQLGINLSPLPLRLCHQSQMANHFLHAKAANAGELRKAVYSRPVESLPQAKPEIMASV